MIATGTPEARTRGARPQNSRWGYLWRHMLAAYPCQEPGGDRLWDVSGRGNHGTFGGGTNSPTRNKGVNWRYLTFAAASSQKVTLPVLLGARQGWTIAALVRWTDTTDKMTLWSEVVAAGVPTTNMNILSLNRSSTDTLVAGRWSNVVYDNAGVKRILSPVGTFNDGKWHLVVSACRTDGTAEASEDGSNAILDSASGNAPTGVNAAALGVQPFSTPLEFGSFDLGFFMVLDVAVPMSMCNQLWADPFGWFRAA